MREEWRKSMDNSTIIKRLQIINDLSQELNVLKEQYEDALENDPQYQKIQEQVEKLKAEQKEQKEQVTEKVLEKSSYKALKDEMKEKKEEIGNHKEILSQELVDYYKETGTLEVEDLNGNVKKMKFSVKLIN